MVTLTFFQLLSFIWYFISISEAAPTSPVTLDKRVATSSYAPESVTCPSTSLIRQADGLSTGEAAYRSARYTKASESLESWLKGLDANFTTSGDMPTLALTTSGGGYRSLLVGAGVIQEFDSRESTSAVAGIYQSLTYQAALSGGAWLLSSIAGNNWPTISYLQSNLWDLAFEDSLLIPDNILAAAASYADILADLEAKHAAGFPPTLTDPWGRLLAYQLLEGTDGGVADTVSGITALSNFTSYNVPYPIISTESAQYSEGQCIPTVDSVQYELHPYEFGSWDSGVAAFVQMAYVGSHLSNGEPVNGTCITNYDNLGYALGSSSTLFNELCSILPTEANSSVSDTDVLLANMVDTTHDLALRDLYAVYPNPFYQYNSSTLVSSDETLYLVDGGESDENDAIWPLLHEARDVDVMIVNDNSADTDDNYPNGIEVLTTYQESVTASLDRMPVIPSVATFIAEGLNQRATFFGCNDTTKITIIFLPNVDYTYDSGPSTLKLEYTRAETAAMIGNGNAVANQNGTSEWPTCLGCAIMKKTNTTLPSACTTCFARYCYN